MPSFRKTEMRARFFWVVMSSIFLVLQSKRAGLDDGGRLLSGHVAARRAPERDPGRSDRADRARIRGGGHREHRASKVDLVRGKDAAAFLRFLAQEGRLVGRLRGHAVEEG